MSNSVEPRLNAAGNYVLGVGADIFSVIATQPLDTFVTHAMSQNTRPPFGFALWRGVAPNCSAALVQGGVPFLINGLIADQFFKNQELSQSQLMASGIFTGAISAGAIAPFERVAKLHQVQGGALYSVCQQSIAENGMRSFFKGVTPIALRDSVVFGTFFGGRRVVENHLEPYIAHTGLKDSAASIGTGVCAGIVSTPFARVNVLMLTDTKGEHPTFNKTVSHLIRQEGVKSLFKGAGMRSGFMAGYYFTLAIGDKMLRNNLPPVFYQKTEEKDLVGPCS